MLNSGDDHMAESAPSHLEMAGKESGKPKRVSDKTARLIEWNVDVLLRLLQQIVARRDAADDEHFDGAILGNDTNPFDEVKEIISLPELNRKQRDTTEAAISDAVVEQLRGYVAKIAALYNSNPFHNFEHVRSIDESTETRLFILSDPILHFLQYFRLLT